MANMWWSIGGGIIIFALGMFIFLKPGLIWKLTEEWKSYRADEPSEFYLKATKIGGALFALFGNYYDYASIYFGVTIPVCRIENTLPAIMVERVSCVCGIIFQYQFSVRILAPR